jgi:hypothetical protein
LIAFAADEDLDNHIVRGMRHRRSGLDIVRVQDSEVGGARDDDVLGWAARTSRVLLSHDVSTMTAAAYARLARGEPMAGVNIVPQWLAIGTALEDLLLIADSSELADWAGCVTFLPLS